MVSSPEESGFLDAVKQDGVAEIAVGDRLVAVVGHGFQTSEGLAAIDTEVDTAVKVGEGGILGWTVVKACL
jgi:hypothetical protein